MSSRAEIWSKRGPLRTLARRFGLDRRGIAAVEFAFLAPILLVMYFMTMEASQAIETSKKVARLGSMVADLAGQITNSSTKSDLEGIMKLGQTALLPYARSAPTITITGVQLSSAATPTATVTWSRKMVNGTFSQGLAVGSPVQIPPALAIQNTFLIKVDSSLAYQPVLAWVAGGNNALNLTAFNGITMGESYLLRPRTLTKLDCTDC